VALIFSWNPTICEIDKKKFEKAKIELRNLRSKQKCLKEKSIKTLHFDKELEPLWNTIKEATSSNKSSSGVSVTKFLHFSFSNIFPMIDSKRMKVLYGETVVNLQTYKMFLKEWKTIYEKNEAKFENLSKKMNMPVARILDIMIFTPK